MTLARLWGGSAGSKNPFCNPLIVRAIALVSLKGHVQEEIKINKSKLVWN